MKSFCLALILFSSLVTAGNDVLDDTKNIKFNTVSQVLDVFLFSGIIPGIQYFVGPCGLQNCTVNLGEDFSMFWGVENVVSCDGTNSRNHPDFNGSLDVGSGEGDFSKLIHNNLPLGATTFYINCIISNRANFYFNNIVAKDSVEFSLNGDAYLYIAGGGGQTIFNNIVIDQTHSLISDIVLTKHDILNYSSNIHVSKIEDINLYTFDFKPSTVFSNSWFFISDKNVLLDDSALPLDAGQCDMLSLQPKITASSYKTTKYQKSNIGFFDSCLLKSNKSYFLNKIYFSN